MLCPGDNAPLKFLKNTLANNGLWSQAQDHAKYTWLPLDMLVSFCPPKTKVHILHPLKYFPGSAIDITELVLPNPNRKAELLEAWNHKPDKFHYFGTTIFCTSFWFQPNLNISHAQGQKIWSSTRP